MRKIARICFLLSACEEKKTSLTIGNKMTQGRRHYAAWTDLLFRIYHI